MDFTIHIADTNILIHSVYNGVFNISRKYLAKEDVKPDFEIYSDDDMISAEYESLKKKNVTIQSMRSTEGLLIQREISELLLKQDTFLIHGAVIAVNNIAYMFTGKSGTGKTTQIKKWLNNVPGSIVVNGDKPLVMLREDQAIACGTPWSGKESMGSNITVPLHSIIFMKRSNENRIENACFTDIFPNLLEQTYMPKEIELQRKTLSLLMKMKERVTFFNFFFDHYKEDSFRVPYEALTQKKLDKK